MTRLRLFHEIPTPGSYLIAVYYTLDRRHHRTPPNRNVEIENQIFFFQFPMLLAQFIPCVCIEERKGTPRGRSPNQTGGHRCHRHPSTAIPKPATTTFARPSPLPPPPTEQRKYPPHQSRPQRRTSKAHLEAQQTLPESFSPQGSLENSASTNLAA